MVKMNVKTFPASLDKLYEMLQFIKDESGQLQFQQDELSKIELAAEEVLVNIISYGYPGRRGSIEICCTSHPDKIELKIVDRGIPYNPLKNPRTQDNQERIEERAIGGYGIFFILKLMDKVDYEWHNESNILTLIKNK